MSLLFYLLQPEIRVNQDVSQERTTVYSHSPFNCRSIKEALTVSLSSLVYINDWQDIPESVGRSFLSEKEEEGEGVGGKRLKRQMTHPAYISYSTWIFFKKRRRLKPENCSHHVMTTGTPFKSQEDSSSRAFFLWLSVPNILYWCLILRQDLLSVFVSVARILLCQHTLSPSVPLPSRLSFQSTSWYSSLLLLPFDGREKERKRLLLLFFFNRLLQADDSVHLLETESQASAETQYKRPAVKVNEEAK